MKQGKVWGHTELIFKNENCEVHRIEIKPNSHCSKHKHSYKHNIFFVEKGILNIKVWKNDYDLIDTTKLSSGDRMDVAPNEFHQFETKDDYTIAFEIYYSEPISGDIVRENCGGGNEVPSL